MRRPPDKDGQPGMSESDVQSSNATLNALFSGSRQKSWLLGSHPPVKPTPRLNPSKSSGGHAVLAQKTTAVLPSPAPSNEASPILPHDTTANSSQVQNRHQDRRKFYNNDNQRLQGSGGAQVPAGVVNQPSEAMVWPSLITQTQSRKSPSEPGVRTSLSSSISIDPQASNLISTVHPSASAATAESPADGQAALRSAQELRSPSLRPSTPPPGGTVGEFHLGESGSIAHPAYGTTEQAAEAEDAPREQLLSPSPAQSSSPVMTSLQPPLPASVLLPRYSQSNPNSVPSNTQKRQRIQAPAPSLKSRIALINAHTESVGGLKYLNNDLESPRFQLLSQACEGEDTFYVALHQLFCMWDTYKRRLVQVLPGFPARPILVEAFQIVGRLIKDNKSMAPNHLAWFADFPSPLFDLMRTSTAYKNVVLSVGQFLGKLAADWTPMSQHCASRGYPPLVDELINSMGVMSPILQRIMFTATRRNLGFLDHNFGPRVEMIFGEDRQGHQELAARMNTSRPPSEREIIERNQALINKYLAVNFLRLRRVSGPVMGLPLATPTSVPPEASGRSTTSSDAPSMASRPQNANPSMSQNLPSADTWHPTPQYQQHQPTQSSRIISNSSPIPQAQAVAGRPLSGAGYRNHPNTPSPTLLQSLSMNSPVAQSLDPQQQQSSQWSAPGPVLRNNTSPWQNEAAGNPDGFASITQYQQQGPQWSGPGPVLRSNSFPRQDVVEGDSNRVVPMGPQQHQYLMLQQHHQQLAAPQYQQQMAAQQQLQIQARQPSRQQIHPQAHPQAYPQTYPLAQQAQQQQQQQQQQRIHTARATQQFLSVNRAAHQLQNNNEVADAQQRTSRGNSVMDASRPTIIRDSPNFSLPRPPPSYVPGPVAQNQAALMYANTEPLQRTLVPPSGFQQPAQPTNPEVTALHQAHLRSPRLVPEDMSSNTPSEDPSRRFYQFVKELAMDPTKIAQSSSVSHFEFTVSEEAFALIPKNKLIGTDPVPARAFKRGSLQYRLRCIRSRPETSKCLVPDWIISETSWPENVFIEINSQQLEVRRKNHHGKDLPIDITQYVVSGALPDDLNRIKVSIPRLRKAPKDCSYFMAVEVVEILQHDQIIDMCTNHQHISASKTLNAIKKSLAPPPTDDDDDFAMVVSDLSIDLADPFTKGVFEIPVRGSSCLHRECFDLMTFLLTRDSKPKRPNQPSMVDIWKCPLCGKDARPCSLQIDDFLASVRADLAAQDRLDTKAILISADGSWRPKPEPRPPKRKATGDLNGDDPDSSDGEETAKKQQVVGRRNNPHLNSVRSSRDIEVIDLD